MSFVQIWPRGMFELGNTGCKHRSKWVLDLNLGFQSVYKCLNKDYCFVVLSFAVLTIVKHNHPMLYKTVTKNFN